MRRFYNGENGRIYTEQELRDSFKELRRMGETEQESFEYYLSCCLDKNGSLTEVAEDFEFKMAQRELAWEVAMRTEYSYPDVIALFKELGVRGTWTAWELKHRPTDWKELMDIVDEEMERKRA